jgi:hypothetical protein
MPDAHAQPNRMRVRPALTSARPCCTHRCGSLNSWPPLRTVRMIAQRRRQRSHSPVLTGLRGRGPSSHQLSHLLTTSGRTVCRKTSPGSDPKSADPPAATRVILHRSGLARTYEIRTLLGAPQR